MTKIEIKYLYKYLAMMIVPASIVFYLVELLFNFLFNESNSSSMRELITKTTTLIIIISMVRLFRKENEKYYNEEHLVSGIYLTFNSVVFMFLIFCTYYGIDIAFNLIEGKPLLEFDNLGSLALNFVLVSIFTIVNLTKNIKLLK
jgi:hypothetical protein